MRAGTNPGVGRLLTPRRGEGYGLPLFSCCNPPRRRYTPAVDNNDLWDPSDHQGMRRRIEEGTLEEWGRAFPAEYGSIRVEAKNLRFVGKPNYTLQDQKKAWMENRELGRSLKADLELYDRETGAQLDGRPNMTLMRVPHYTDRGTFVYNGNNYSASSQARMVPGIYTRRQNNGGLEAAINTRSGTGRVFRVGMDQDTGQFRLKIAGSNLHLYSVLKDSGISDAELEKMWGTDITEINRKKYDPRAITKAFQKFVPRYLQGTAEDETDRGALLMDALNKAQVSKASTDRTLAAYWTPRDPDKVASGEARSMLRLFFPKRAAAAKPSTFSAGFDIRSQMGERDDEGDEYRSVGLDGLLAATKKLLAVNRGLDVPDERSIPTFTKVYTMDKLMRERIRFDEGKIRRNLLRMVNSRKNLSPIHHRVFDPYYKEIITKNPLTTPLEETNPLQLLGQQRRITHMGPGGIGSPDAITPDMTAIKANEMGFYSVIEGPECLDELSEVYTLRGWVPWPEVMDTDVFACRIEGRLEWHQAERIIRQHYEGPMIVGEHETIRLKVTPTHRVYRLYGRNTWKFDVAREVHGEQIKVPIRHLPYAGKPEWDFFELPQVPKTNSNQRFFKGFQMDDWCAFVGWWLSEGHSCTHNLTSSGGSKYARKTISITQCPVASTENCKELSSLLVRMGLRAEGLALSKKYTISSKQVVEYFSRYTNGCYEKWIPEELFEAPISSRTAMLDALLKGDGRYNKKRWCYCSVSKRLAESVERLAISLGFTAFIRVEKDWRPHVTTTNYVVSVHRQNTRQLMGAAYEDKRSGKKYGNNWRTEHYSGTVYCATVPGGLLHVRGKKSNSGHWTGNSGAAGIDVRLSWGALIGKDGRIRRPLLNRRSGQEEMVSPDQLYDKFLKLPG